MSEPQSTPDVEAAARVGGGRLGPWTLVRRLGAGGAAEVWEAHDDDGREVALKVFLATDQDPVERQRAEREVRTLAALHDPRIVRYVASGEDVPEVGGAARRWLAMSRVDGQDVDALVAAWEAEPPPDRWARVERIVRDLCGALATVHEAGLLHRDVKPANLLVDREGGAHLTDFGVARAVDAARSTPPGEVAGTVAWMAPEAIADGTLDARTDLYGVGAVLYLLLTGRRPFEAASWSGFLARHLHERPVAPHRYAPDVPARLERVCLRLLEKAPALRYPTARAVLDALDGLTGVEPPRLHGRDDVVGPLLGALAPLTAAEAEGGPRGGRRALVGPPGSGRTAVLEVVAHAARELGLPVVWVGTTGEPLPPPTQPSVVLVEDVDEAAPALLARLGEAEAAVVGSGAPWLLIATGRSVVWRVDRDAPPEPVVHALTPWNAEAVADILRERGVEEEVVTRLAGKIAGTDAAWPRPLSDQLRVLVEEGWLIPEPTTEGRAPCLRAGRPLASFTDRDLPPTEAVRRAVRQRLARMDDEVRELVELMAVVERPLAASLLARAASRPARVPAVLPGLMALDLVLVRSSSDDHQLLFRLPGTASAVLADLDPGTRAVRHRAVAVALQRQRLRGAPWAEIGRHFAAAGEPVEARVALERGAAQALATRQWAEVAEIADTLRALGAPDAVHEGLRGRARLGQHRLEDAIAALTAALAAQPPGGQRATDEVELAEALRRARRSEEADRHLDAVASEATVPAPVRVRALTLRGALRFQAGDVAEAERLLTAAAEAASDARLPEAEARARRLLGAVYAIRLDLRAASEQLGLADDLLAVDGDPVARARVLVYGVIIDRVIGRLGLAMHRAEVLVDLCAVRELTAVLPSAWSVQAEILEVAGEREGAAAAARRALSLARAPTRPGQRPAAVDADGVLRALRVLLDLGDADVAAAGAPFFGRLVERGLTDVAGQEQAVRARVLAATAPEGPDGDSSQEEALALARGVLLRPRPPDPRAWFDRTRDAALALIAVGAMDEAREALLGLDRPGLSALGGVWLEVLRLRRLAGDREALTPLAALVESLAPGVPPRCLAGWRARALGVASA